MTPTLLRTTPRSNPVGSALPVARHSGTLIGGRRSKWVVLAVWAVLIGVFAPLGLKLPQVTNDEVVLPSGSETARVDRALAARFRGGNEQSVFVVYRRAGGLTAADRRTIGLDVNRVAGLPLVEGTRVPFGPGATPGLVSAKGDVAVTVVLLASQGIFRVQPT